MSQTPRERQVAEELRRFDCAESGGHVWSVGNEACVKCGELYPVIVMHRADDPSHDFDYATFGPLDRHIWGQA